MSGKRKRILLLITNLTFGGAQRVFHDQSEVLSDRFEVFECVFNNDLGTAFPTGKNVISLNVPAGKTWIGKVFRFLQRIYHLKKIKKQYHIDVCISHLEGADLVNILSKNREKVVTWVHGSKRFDQNISGLIGFIRHQFLIPYTYSRADHVVTVSKAIKEELIKYYRVKPYAIQTIYNYFDVPDIRTKARIPLAEKYKSVFSTLPVLLFSGRLAKQKNTLAMITWFAAFVKTNPSKLVILGDGELRSEMLKHCTSLDLNFYSCWADMELHGDYQVYFLGFQENPFQLMIRASIFILPSLWEGFPMAIGEAMACGIPVASADCPTGPKEMLTESGESLPYPFFASYGLLLPLLNEKTFTLWSTGISELLDDERKRERYAIQSSLRAEDFSKGKNAMHTSKLIESVL